MIRHLLALLLLSGTAQALPAATTDAAGIARALAEPCAAVVAAQTTPDELCTVLGPGNLQQLASSCGLSPRLLAEASDGRAFLAVYEGDTVIGLGLKSPLAPTAPRGQVQGGWLLIGDPVTIGHFLGESGTLADSVRFSRIASRWPGGEVLLYSGDLLTPSKQLAYDLQEQPGALANIRQTLSVVPPCPQICAGLSGSQLEAWVAPLAPDVPSGQAWTSTFANGKLHRQTPPGLYDQAVNVVAVVETLEDVDVTPPLEWKLFLGIVSCIDGSQKQQLSLPMALTPMLGGQTPSPSAFQETLQAQGDGLWLYRLDPKQTAQLVELLHYLVEGKIAPTASGG